MINTKPRSKTPTTAKAKKPGSDNLAVKPESAEDKEMYTAKLACSPVVRGAVTTEAFSKDYGQTNLKALFDLLNLENKKVRRGDLSRADNLLMTQANTLDAIFNELARRAATNMGEYMNATERYLRLALKAQSQCRATLETLAAIKNPPVIYAKQANIANGPQQVNNGILPAPVGGENSIEPNKLLEQRHEQRLDTGTQGTTIGADSAMATVG
ncbi:MAG: hypothetical protein WBO95_10525 [Candidatus Dechloromonas phosphoritropha]